MSFTSTNIFDVATVLLTTVMDRKLNDLQDLNLSSVTRIIQVIIHLQRK